MECSSQADATEELRSGMLEISPVDSVERVGSGWAPFLLDVRREDEERLTSLEGTSLRIQHNSVPQRSDEIPRDRDVVVYCRTGVRSAAVARYLVTSRD